MHTTARDVADGREPRLQFLGRKRFTDTHEYTRELVDEEDRILPAHVAQRVHVQSRQCQGTCKEGRVGCVPNSRDALCPAYN